MAVASRDAASAVSGRVIMSNVCSSRTVNKDTTPLHGITWRLYRLTVYWNIVFTRVSLHIFSVTPLRMHTRSVERHNIMYPTGQKLEKPNNYYTLYHFSWGCWDGQ